MPQEITTNARAVNNPVTVSSGIHWATENRKHIITTVLAMLGIIIVAVAAGVFATLRANKAAAAFGSAMEIYQSAIDVPGQPPIPGTKSYPSVEARAKDANAAFAQVANSYPMTRDGKNARYFQGVTYLEEGQTQSAEDTLKKVAGEWNSELASLGKFALADLYHQTGRDAQAIDLYNQLAARPTDAVPAGNAQLQLAELYESQGKTGQAHDLYAKLKDKDPKSAAGQVAAKKLNPNAPTEPQL